MQLEQVPALVATVFDIDVTPSVNEPTVTVKLEFTGTGVPLLSRAAFAAIVIALTH